MWRCFDLFLRLIGCLEISFNPTKMPSGWLDVSGAGNSTYRKRPPIQGNFTRGLIFYNNVTARPVFLNSEWIYLKWQSILAPFWSAHTGEAKNARGVWLHARHIHVSGHSGDQFGVAICCRLRAPLKRQGSPKNLAACFRLEATVRTVTWRSTWPTVRTPWAYGVSALQGADHCAILRLKWRIQTSGVLM
jgi:hypothetical protein